MPSSADVTQAALERAADAVCAAVAALPRESLPPIVLIDGQSGAGKTTLAALLRERWIGPVAVIALDDIYTGWDGLSDGARIVRERILVPLAVQQPARWRRWDWEHSVPGDEVETPAGTAVIIEGSGVLSAASAVFASVRVWLESPEDVRRARALARDGDAYRPYWERWAAQERQHLVVDTPRTHATIIVDVP